MYVPYFLSILRILFPVTCLTCGIPCESRSNTPICDGVSPFFANLHICSAISSGVAFCHAGADRLYGSAEEDIPLPGVCMRPCCCY